MFRVIEDAFGFLGVNDFTADQLLERGIHGLHAEFLAGLHDRGNLRYLAFTDEIADGGRADHDFERGNAPGAVTPLEQALGNNGLQGFGELGA